MQSQIDENDRRAQTTAVTLGQIGEKIDRSEKRAEAIRTAALDRSQAYKANEGDHNG